MAANYITPMALTMGKPKNRSQTRSDAPVPGRSNARSKEGQEYAPGPLKCWSPLRPRRTMQKGTEEN